MTYLSNMNTALKAGVSTLPKAGEKMVQKPSDTKAADKLVRQNSDDQGSLDPWVQIKECY